jgi:hypothetical protein
MPATTAPSPMAVLDPSDILTPEELANRLKVRPTWVYEQRRNKRNRIPTLGPGTGRYLRYSWREVCEWMQAQRKSKAGAR